MDDKELAAWFTAAYGAGIVSMDAFRAELLKGFDTTPAAIGKKGKREHRGGAGNGGGAGPGGGPGNCPLCGAGPGWCSHPTIPGPAPRGPDPDPDPGLEPFHAWKVAYLAPEAGTTEFPFRSTNDRTPYGAYAVAVCSKGLDHLAPQENCSCGFYAKAERHEAEALLFPGKVLLEVELYGKVIPGTIGYRGQKQRVLAVWVKRSDLHGRKCAAPGCPHRTLFEIVHSEVAVCATHALAQDYRFREVPDGPVPDIGTEWRWIDEPEGPAYRAPRVSTDPRARGSIWTGPAS